MNHSKAATKGIVLVIGGGGFYGRYLVSDLLRYTEAEIIIASRQPPKVFAEHRRVNTAVCDLNDLGALEKLTSICDIVVHCAGPFQYLPLNPLRAAIRTRTHYVDIAEDRKFAQEVQALEQEIRAAGISVLSGVSVAPAMEALFTEMFRPCFDSLLSVRTFAAPDTRKHRGNAMFRTMLMGVGRPFLQPRNGKPVRVFGWTEAEWIEFPPPLGKRLTYLVLEMADLDLLPRLFGIQTVEFKAGTEHAILNRLLGWAATLRARTGYPEWERFTPLVRALSWLVGRFGKDEGGVVFEIGGIVSRSVVKHQIALVARRDGGLIPSVLASIAVQRLLDGDLKDRGLVPIHSWISSRQLVEALEHRGLELWWQPFDQSGWQPFALKERCEIFSAKQDGIGGRGE